MKCNVEHIDDIYDLVRWVATQCDKNTSCVDFHYMLVENLPEGVEGKPYYDGNHVTTMINGCLWDRTGLRHYPMEIEPSKLEKMKDWKTS